MPITDALEISHSKETTISIYGAKIQGSLTFVDGSLSVNHDNDTATDPVFKDELLFRLITTISF